MPQRKIESHEIINLFKYLDVKISTEDQNIFRKKILKAQQITADQLNNGKPDLIEFSSFPENIVESFMKRDYKDAWIKDSMENVPEVKADLAAIGKNRALSDVQKEVERAKILHDYSKKHFQKHLDEITAGDLPANEKRNELLLAHQAKIAQNTEQPDVEKYLRNQVEQYQKQAAIFSKLNTLIAHVEGFHNCTKPDVRRWAKYIAQAEDKESRKLLGQLKIGSHSEEFAESLEEHGKLVASVLMGIGIAVSTAGMVISALHGEGKSDEIVIDFGRNNDFGDNPLVEINEGAIGLTAGLVALLNGDTKAAMVNISAGLLSLSSTAVKLASDFGSNFLAFAHHIPVVSLASIALSGGIAAYQHHQMRKTEQTVSKIEDSIENMERILKGQDKQEALMQSMIKIANELTAEPQLTGDDKNKKIQSVEKIGEQLRDRITEIESELNALKLHVDDKFELPNTRVALEKLRDEICGAVDKNSYPKTTEDKEKLAAIERALRNTDISEVLEEQKAKISKAIELSNKIVSSALDVAKSKDELATMSLPKTTALQEVIEEEKSVLKLAAQSKRQEAASIRKNRNNTFKAMAYLASMTALSVVGFAFAATPAGWAIAGAGLAIGIALAGRGIYKRYQEKKEARENVQRLDKIRVFLTRIEGESTEIEDKIRIDINKRFNIGNKPSMSFKTYVEEQARKNPTKAVKIIEAFNSFYTNPNEDSQAKLKAAMSEKENQFDIFSTPTGKILFNEMEKDMQAGEGESENIHM